MTILHVNVTNVTTLHVNVKDLTSKCFLKKWIGKTPLKNAMTGRFVFAGCEGHGEGPGHGYEYLRSYYSCTGTGSI